VNKDVKILMYRCNWIHWTNGATRPSGHTWDCWRLVQQAICRWYKLR